MSRELFARNADLKRLQDEGYFLQLRGPYLVMRDVPYVNAAQEVRRGTLVSTLELAGDTTRPPQDHQVWFDGDYPCHADGRPIEAIRHTSENFNLGHGVTAKHRFSSKPDGQLPRDYHHKLATYAGVISGPAAVRQPGVTALTFRVPEEEGDGVFNYLETATGRAGIGALAELLATETVAIIGLGGTGSYVLDLVAKTPVRQIRLFDADEFLQHNAFRAPGAPSIDELRAASPKVEYLHRIYSRMHRGIVPHSQHLTADTLHLLEGVTFAFLCLDGGEAKRAIVERLEQLGASFVDTGMGLTLTDNLLGGMLRVTASTPEHRQHFRNRVSFASGGPDDIYATNIQVADLNALNAAMAVIKWKKLRGFYRDFEREHHTTYTTDTNQLDGGDQALCECTGLHTNSSSTCQNAWNLACFTFRWNLPWLPIAAVAAAGSRL